MSAATLLYVSPHGDDSAPGTLEEPVRTLREAIVRTRACGGGSKRVIVREGRYYDVGIDLTPEDAGLSIEAYPNERPVLYGGLPVTAWEREDELVAAALDGVKERERDFRVIEVEGGPRPRAKLPESGTFHHRNIFDVPWMSTQAGGWQRTPTEEELSSLKVDGGDIGDWLDVSNAEVTIYHEWDESLVGVRSFDVKAGVLHFTNRPGHPPGSFADRNPNAHRYALWNVKEGMTRPGQWYLDRTRGKLVYWPLPGESASSLHVVAPTRRTIVRLHPGACSLQFRGLTFACSAAELAAGGFAAMEVEAAIEAEDVRDVVFEDVTVCHTSGWGIRLSGEKIRLAGCHVHHTGAGGIDLKGDRIEVSRSVIHDVGLVYQSAVGVMCHGSEHTLAHNEIHHTPYCGIVNVSSDTAITSNLFHDVMTFMKDGAAIYATRCQNVRISGNAVFADAAAITRSYAYYLDELCESCAVEGNLAVHTRLPFLSHMTKSCSCNHNVFLDQGTLTVSAPNSSDLCFERNVLAADAIELYAPAGNPQRLPSTYDNVEKMRRFSTANGIGSCRNNVFFSRGNRAQFLEYLHYTVIREHDLREKDGNAFTDPLIQSDGRGRFDFAPDSPAHALGIQALDFTGAGCTGRMADLLASHIIHSEGN